MSAISYISVVYGPIRDLFAAYCSEQRAGSNYDLKKGVKGGKIRLILQEFLPLIKSRTHGIFNFIF